MKKYIVSDIVSYEDEFRDSEANFAVIVVDMSDIEKIKKTKDFISDNQEVINIDYSASIIALGNNYSDSAQEALNDFYEDFNNQNLTVQKVDHIVKQDQELRLRVDYSKMCVNEFGVSFYFCIKHDNAYAFCGNVGAKELEDFILSDKECLILDSCAGTQIAV